MALGSNRDYKTRARQVDKALAKHIELMNKYIGEGMSKDEASKKAYKKVLEMKITGRK